jgi:hypothetical protein
MTRWKPLKMEHADRTDPTVKVTRLSGIRDSTPGADAPLAEVQDAACTGRLRLVPDLHGIARIGSAGGGIVAA